MAETYTNPKNDRRSLTHRGSEVGDGNIELSQNDPDREDWVLRWTCPRKFESITYSAGDHVTKFYPRTKQVEDGDGETTSFDVDVNIAPPNGETNIDEMEYQPVVAYDAAAGQQLEVESYDFDANTVTFASAPDSGTGNLLMWPFLTEGYIKYIGLDQFGNQIASLDTWGIPIHVFNDFEQAKNMTKVHLTGAATIEEEETVGIYINSPHNIVWDDGEYPEGEYASTIEQRVDVNV